MCIRDSDYSVGLLGMDGIYAGATIKFISKQIVIGRDPRECNVILLGNKISRKHCVIWYDRQEGMYAVKDCSVNGVFQENGERMQKNIPVFLKKQSVIYIATPENSFKLM